MVGWYLRAVVIKACALKGVQSIQLSASASHQASAKNESPGPEQRRGGGGEG